MEILSEQSSEQPKVESNSPIVSSCDKLDNDDFIQKKLVKYNDPAKNSQQKANSNSCNNFMNVFVRFRPTENENADQDKHSLTVLEKDSLNSTSNLSFKFHQIFTEKSSQKEIFTQTVGPLVNDIFIKSIQQMVLNFLFIFFLEKTALLFTYGVTNSGQTHTIIGNEQNPGLLPRFSETILQIKKLLLEKANSVQNISEGQIITVSGIDLKLQSCLQHNTYPQYTLSDIQTTWESFEIYNEDIFDLSTNTENFDPKQITMFNPSKMNPTPIKPQLIIKENQFKQNYVKDLLTVEIKDNQHLKQLVARSIQNRSIGETLLNAHSSRSHCFYQIDLQFQYRLLDLTQSKQVSFCMVDLAGSERAKKTQNIGQAMKESCNINNSLLVLGRCLKAMYDMKNQSNIVVPYRDCKLTRLLNDYFSQENNIVMIANINPASECFEETLQVLNYAAIAQDIKPLKSRFEVLTSFSHQKINNTHNNNSALRSHLEESQAKNISMFNNGNQVQQTQSESNNEESKQAPQYTVKDALKNAGMFEVLEAKEKRIQILEDTIREMNQFMLAERVKAQREESLKISALFQKTLDSVIEREKSLYLTQLNQMDDFSSVNDKIQAHILEQQNNNNPSSCSRNSAPSQEVRIDNGQNYPLVIQETSHSNAFEQKKEENQNSSTPYQPMLVDSSCSPFIIKSTNKENQQLFRNEACSNKQHCQTFDGEDLKLKFEKMCIMTTEKQTNFLKKEESGDEIQVMEEFITKSENIEEKTSTPPRVQIQQNKPSEFSHQKIQKMFEIFTESEKKDQFISEKEVENIDFRITFKDELNSDKQNNSNEEMIPIDSQNKSSQNSENPITVLQDITNIPEEAQIKLDDQESSNENSQPYNPNTLTKSNVGQQKKQKVGRQQQKGNSRNQVLSASNQSEGNFLTTEEQKYDAEEPIISQDDLKQNQHQNDQLDQENLYIDLSDDEEKENQEVNLIQHSQNCEEGALKNNQKTRNQLNPKQHKCQ